MKTELGPDATGVGWVFQYALVDAGAAQPGGAALRPGLVSAVPPEDGSGVAEVAPLGGFVRQYQVNVDPNRLRAYGIPITKVVAAVRAGNNDVGGGWWSYAAASTWCADAAMRTSTDDLETIVAAASATGVPVRVHDVGTCDAGPGHSPRRSDLDGQGEVVSGIVVMRQGENALDVIDRVKAKLKEIEPACRRACRWSRPTTAPI